MKVNGEPVRRRPLRDPGDRRPAREQVKTARARAEQRRANASRRINEARARRAGRKADYSNTPGAAVVFGGLLGLAVLFGIGTVGYSVYKSEAEQNKIAQYAHADGSVSISHGDVVASSTGHTHYDEHHEGYGGDHADSWYTASDLPAVDAELLLMSMLPQPIETELMDEIVKGTLAMEESGVSFIGSIKPDVEEHRSIDLIAELQMVLGSTPVDADAFHATVQDWLLTMPFDGVLVLYNPPVDSGHTGERAFLITDQFYADHALAHETVPVLLHELASNGYDD